MVNRDPSRAATSVLQSHQGTAHMIGSPSSWRVILLIGEQRDSAWTPALVQWKIRELELRAGHGSQRGGNKPGPARDYSLKTVRDV